MSNIRYTKTHEWVLIDGDIATVGITPYAQEALGDVVYVELPDAGREAVIAKEIAVVESVKAASEIYAPLSGVITESNSALSSDPALVNKDALGEGWFFKLQISNAAEIESLLEQSLYDTYLEELR